MMTEFTPGPWTADNGDGYSAWTIWSGMTPTGSGPIGHMVATGVGDSAEADANARLIAAAPELLAALQAYQSAQAMPIYGDASDFIGGVVTMRQPGNSAYGWICDKHGLGYTGGCICCADEHKSYSAQKDREARYARDDALRAAESDARAAIAKATGVLA